MSNIVNVTRSGNLLRVTGPGSYLSALMDKLTYFKQVANKWPERQKAKFKHVKTCLYHNDNNTLVVPSGFTTKTYLLASESGLKYSFTDLRKLNIPEPRFDLLGDVEFRDRQDECLAALCSNDHGIVRAPTGFGKTELIKFFCQIYPTINIVVCAQQQSIVKAIYERLDSVIRDVGIVGAGYNHPDRITVSTARSLEKARLDKTDILLFDEVHCAAADGTRSVLATVRDARKFGFSASPYGRHDQADLETEALFGPIIFDCEYQAAVNAGSVANIEVAMIRVPGSAINYDDFTAKERWGFWRNQTRNQMIADVANKLPEDEQALIIVSKIEHGLALSKLLPGWEFVYGDNFDTDGFKSMGYITDEFTKLSKSARDDLRQKFEAGTLKRAIATSVWNTGVDFKHLTWLIRADGGTSVIGSTQIPGRLSRVQYKNCGFLIDFYDSFDPTLLNRSTRRVKTYTEKGWNVSRFDSISAFCSKYGL